MPENAGNPKEDEKMEKIKQIMLFVALSFGVLIAITILSGDSDAMPVNDKYVGNHVVDIEWQQYANDAGNFSHYSIYRGGSRIRTESNRENTFCRDKGAAVGVDYTYRVEVINKTGNEILNGSVNVHTGDVHGIITLETSWDDGEYRLSADVVVIDTLHISRGVTVNLTGGRLQVQGKIDDLEGVNINGHGVLIEKTNSEMDNFKIIKCHFNGSATGGYMPGTAIEIKGINGVTITENTIENYDKGIYVQSVFGPSHGDNVSINKNQINNCGDGIYVSQEFHNYTINNNVIRDNDAGIHMYGARGLLIKENHFYDNGNGTRIRGGSEGNEISDNEFENSTYYGLHADQCGETLVKENIFDGTFEEKYWYMHSACVYLERSNNITLQSNSISNSSSSGISIYDQSKDDHHTVQYNSIWNNTDYGIYNMRSNRNEFKENSIHRNEDGGIFVGWSNYCSITSNVIEGNKYYGIYFSGSTTGEKGHAVTNNTIYDNGNIGIAVGGIRDSYIGYNRLEHNRGGIYLKDQANNNTLHRNEIIRDEDDNSTYDIAFASTAANNIVKENTLGNSKWEAWGEVPPVKISLYHAQGGYIQVRSVKDLPANPAPPEYPFKATNISSFVEISCGGEGASIELWFHYTDEQLEMGSGGGYVIPAESLKVWRYGEVGTRQAQRGGGGGGNITRVWRLGDEKGEEPWNGSRKLDVFDKIVGVEVKKFSIFAPLSRLPVHNLNTNRDFDTINSALYDYMTHYGDVIAVDPEYTGTKEFMAISTKITLMSSSGNPEDTVIETVVSDEPVIEINTFEGVTINGFTIKGALQSKGIWSHDVDDVTISNCVITGNKYGVHLENGKNFKVEGCKFHGNTDGGLYFEDAENANVTSSSFEDKIGVHFKKVTKSSAFMNTFTDTENIGLYTFDSEGTTIEKNDIVGGGKGIFLEKSKKSNLKDNTLTLCGDYGLYLLESEENTITGGALEDITPTAVYLKDSSDNDINQVRITCEEDGPLTGIVLFHSDHNTLSDIELHDLIPNTGGITGIELTESSSDNIVQRITMKDFNAGAGGITGTALTASSSDNIVREITMKDFNAGAGGITGIEVAGSSSKNTLQEITMEDFNTDTGAITGIKLTGVSLNNQLKDITMKNFRSGTITGILVNASWNSLEDVEMSSFPGGTDAAGVRVVRANNITITGLKANIINSSKAAAGIFVGSGEKIKIENSKISRVTSKEHRGTGVLFDNSRGCQLTNSSILNNEIGVLCENAAAPEIHWNTISGNTVYGIKNTDPTITVKAENNFWGDKSGPGPVGPGTGDKVSN